MKFKNGDFVVRKGNRWVAATTQDALEMRYMRVWFKGRATGGFYMLKPI